MIGDGNIRWEAKEQDGVQPRQLGLNRLDGYGQRAGTLSFAQIAYPQKKQKEK